MPREVVIQLYAGATVFCCPSIYEPLGIINLEAMACGTPVVASAVGGIPEVVVEGETGFLVPDAVAMAEAIGRAGAISPERCRVEARARFDEAAMTARYIALYRQLAGAAD